MKNICVLAVCIFFILAAQICVAAETMPNLKVAPKKVQMDTNYDGKIDRIEIYDSDGQIVRLEADTNGDDIMDEWVVFEKGDPAKKEKDTNGDGKPDVWVEY